MKARIIALAAPVLLLVLLWGGMALLPASPADAQSVPGYAYVVLQSTAITNGNGTLAAINNTPYQYAELTVQATGLVSGTINWEATIDGTNFVALPATNIASGSAAITTTAAGVFRMDTTGLRSVRARVSDVVTNTTDTISVAGFLTAP
jgi:hypothetical protein